MGLGSNKSFMGLKPCEILRRACIELDGVLKDMSVSSVYRTAAMYVTDQEDFYNMVVEGGYEGSPAGLLENIHAIENQYGRDRSKEIRFGPRPLDVDIELFGDYRVCESDLIIPHERMKDRAFVLVPYLEILRRNADANRDRIEFYEDCLSVLMDQRIDKCIDWTDFLSERR